MKKTEILSITILSFLLSLQAAQAQDRYPVSALEAGLPIIQNFSPKDYDAYSQNWAIVQGHDGIMYFGNGSGVLTFDGVNWRLIPVSNNSVVRSLAVDGKNGTIYVGARGEFGYLAPDSTGVLRYLSLLDRLKPEMLDFGDVWEILQTSRGVFFRTANYLFLLKQDRLPGLTATESVTQSDMLESWQPPDSPFFFGHVVNDTIFITLTMKGGLLKLVGDTLQEVATSRQIEQEEVYAIFPLKHDSTSTKHLVFTRLGTVYTFEGAVFEPVAVDPRLTKYLHKNFFFRAAALPDRTFALATASGGVVIIDQQGEIIHMLTQATGLPDDGVFYAHADREGGLWLALNNGLARVEWPAPLSFYPEDLGIDSNVEDVIRHDGILYVATGLGLHYLASPETPGAFPVFMPVPELNKQTWSLVSTEEGLIVATHFGVYLVGSGRTPELLTHTGSFYQVCRLKYRNNFILLGYEKGLMLLQKIGGRWQSAGKFPGITQQVRSIVEQAPAVLWLGTRSSGYLQVIFPEDFFEQDADKVVDAGSIQLQVEHFDKTSGVPDGLAATYRIIGKTVFATQKGLRRFDEESRRFVPDSTLGIAFADTTRWIHPLSEDPDGNVWITSGTGTQSETIRLVRQPDGGYTTQRPPFLRASEVGGYINTIYGDPENKDVVWVGTSEMLLRYNLNIEKDYQVDYPCIVRRVIARGDSAIYGGDPLDEMPHHPSLTYQDNSLRFEYAATSFEAPAQTRYQTWLEGFDTGWSRWTEETQKDYTNIPEGSYAFRVRARNVYQHLSSEGRYQFSILPPWYRTFGAYSGYLVFVVSGILLLVRWRVQRLRAHAHRLEGIIAQRTVELAEKNEKLQEMDTLKSRFFANISHEFRTPLTLIMGQINSLQSEEPTDMKKAKLALASRNAARLLNLINQLLDLSKLEAGQMALRACEQDVVPVLRAATANFESHATQRNIRLSFSAEPESIPLYFEQEKLEKVIYNLLSNALKFTKENGWVKVEVSVEHIISDARQHQPIEELPAGECKLVVRDSGIGIPIENLPHIFDHFYQVNPSETREHEGTGIGLALTQELVQLHGGMIAVESEVGAGATFTVSLPLGKAHLRPEQIVKSVSSRPSSMDAEIEEPLTAPPDSGGSDFAEKPTTGDHPPITPSFQHSTTPRIQESVTPTNLVLIVEDNDEMRALIRDNLPEEYSVIEAPNGEAGFALALEHTPDVIITDVMMPVMDGYSLTHKLRAHEATNHIPVIMLTAKATEEDRFEGLERGVDAYLTKPFNKQELLIRMRKLIELRQQLLARVQTRSMISASGVMVTSMDQQFLERLQEIVEANMEDEEFQVEDMGRSIGLSRSQLQRKLSALLDCSPAAYLRRVRLERAKQLLEQNAGTVSEICFQVGYGNVSAFARAFREAFGQPPSQFARKK